MYHFDDSALYYMRHFDENLLDSCAILMVISFYKNEYFLGLGIALYMSTFEIQCLRMC